MRKVEVTNPEAAVSEVADSIRCGLKQAVAYAKGEADVEAYRGHVPPKVDVRAIRAKLGLTQEEFAARFGFSVDTLRQWEQGRQRPENSAWPTCQLSTVQLRRYGRHSPRRRRDN